MKSTTKSKMNFSSKWILITGASSGLGLEMAKQLAYNHSANLILIARSEGKLQELKSTIESNSTSQCLVITADLSIEEDVNRVFIESTKHCDVYAAVLNAGITYFGHDSDLDWKGFNAILSTNVTGVMQLSRLFTPYLMDQDTAGAVMFVTSMAGLAPTPYQSVYSGSKAFVTQYAQCLAAELRKENLSISIFAPGGISTEMGSKSGLDFFEGSILMQSVESCAKDAITTLQKRKTLHVPRLINQVQLFFTRLLPRFLPALLAAKTYEEALDSPKPENNTL